MLRGITVTLWERTENGVDAFNNPTNLERMIVQLRVELLELKKEL